jgi:hypothetical protein
VLASSDSTWHTTRAFQAERNLAQRIVDNVRNIHARAGVEVGQAG